MISSLDHESPVPLRAQVEKLLRNLALRPEFQKGALLPDEVTLATQLGVSRGTVRSGISKLVFEGLLERKAGVGTMVSGRNLESGIRAWRSFSREMASKGIKVQNFQAGYEFLEAPATTANALRVKPKTQLWRLERLRGWNNCPVLHTTSWFHPRLGLTGTEEFTKPLYEVLEKTCGVRPHHAREEFLATVPGERMAQLLKVSADTPLLLRRHTVFDSGNRPFEFAEVRYVSARFTLTLDMRKGGT